MASFLNWLERSGLYVALLAAWIAMMGSLYFSEVAGYIPCTLCWYQRILMYPLAGIIAIGLLRRDRDLPYYILPFSLLGIVVSTYHYLLQKTDLFGTTACKVGVPCTSMWINWFGFATIPFLALTAFITITLMAIIVLQAEPQDEESEASYEVDTEDETEDEFDEEMPWRPVGAIILPVVGVYLILSLLSGMGETNGIDSETHSSSLANSSVSTVNQADVALIDGATLYQQACAACHGMQLEGVEQLGNTLAPSDFVAERSDDEMLAFIRAGRGLDDPDNTTGLVMPESGGRPDLSDAEMLAVIHHIRTAEPKTE